MKRYLLAGMAMTALFAAGSAFASPLDGFRWSRRPVIVFADAGGNLYDRQVRKLRAASGGLRERDIVVIGVAGGDASALIGGPDPRQGADAFRKAYGVPSGRFEVLLVGKDGGVKFRARDLVSPSEIFRIVDAMPMRRQEMRR